jgi:hypothetical protein
MTLNPSQHVERVVVLMNASRRAIELLDGLPGSIKTHRVANALSAALADIDIKALEAGMRAVSAFNIDLNATASKTHHLSGKTMQVRTHERDFRVKFDLDGQPREVAQKILSAEGRENPYRVVWSPRYKKLKAGVIRAVIAAAETNGVPV